MSVVNAGLATTRLLRDRGVRFAFGVPGESFLGLLDALYDTPEIQLVATRHEGGASFMAEAAGKLTGLPAICMGTRAVGAANLAIGLHTAHQDSTPLLAFVGQAETDVRHREALQETELAAFLGPITKWAVEIPSSERLPEIAAEAFRRSVSGRPGPVAIAVRGDTFLDPVDYDDPGPSALPATAMPDTVAAQVVSMLRTAQAPVIIAGGGVLRARATAELATLAEQLAVPVVTTFRRHDAFPNDHPLYIGPLSFGGPASIAERVRRADVVLALGTRLSEMTTLGYSLPGDGAKLIHVDVSPDVLGRTYPATVAVAAGAREAISALLAVEHDQPSPERLAANTRDRTAYVTGSTPSSVPAASALVDPALVMAELQRQLPPDAIVTTDAGNFWGWAARYLQFRRPGTLLSPTSGAMGYAVPAAVSAAIVTDNRVPVVALAGDGGFLMTGSELAVAAQLGRRVLCVVFDNALYGTIRLHQERSCPGRIAGTELWSPDFVRYAEAFGGLGLRVECNDDLAEAVHTALTHPGIVVLSVAVSQETIAVGTRMSEVAAR
jgi:acetolactate synthase-1/2/3 large subunit